MGQLRFMSDHFEVIAIASPGEDLQSTSTREGVKTASVEMTRTISPCPLSVRSVGSGKSKASTGPTWRGRYRHMVVP